MLMTLTTSFVLLLLAQGVALALSNRRTSVTVSSHSLSAAETSQSAVTNLTVADGQVGELNSQSRVQATTNVAISEASPNESDVAELISIGFSKVDATYALAQVSGSEDPIEDATNYLLDESDAITRLVNMFVVTREGAQMVYRLFGGDANRVYDYLLSEQDRLERRQRDAFWRPSAPPLPSDQRQKEDTAKTASSEGQARPQEPTRDEIQVSLADQIKQIKVALRGELRTVSAKPDAGERRRQFRDIFRRWHPDKNPDNRALATVIFQWLVEQRRPVYTGEWDPDADYAAA